MAERGRRHNVQVTGKVSGTTSESSQGSSLASKPKTSAVKLPDFTAVREKFKNLKNSNPIRIKKEQRENPRMQEESDHSSLSVAPIAAAAADEIKKHQFGFLKVAAGIVAIAAIGLCSAFAFDRAKDAETMGCKISVCGEDVSWLSIDEAAEKIQTAFQSTRISFQEGKKKIYSVSLGEAGYSLDQNRLISELTKVKENRKSCSWLLEKSKEIPIDYQVVWNDQAMTSAFSNEHMDNGSERVASSNAQIEYSGDTKRFEIIPSTLGNVIDNQKLLNRIQGSLNTSFAESLLTDTIDISIDESLYKVADVLETDSSLLAKLDTLNDEIDRYTNTTVTYTFGSVTEVVDSSVIQDWIIIDDDMVSLDEYAIHEYVENLGAKYNTQYVPRYFTNSYGEQVLISNNEYGYWIDEDAEIEELLNNLESGESVTREPIYSSAGWYREGTDDLVGGYVEVNLTTQHIWLYVNGELIIESDCVTGQPSAYNATTNTWEDRSTCEGSYPIAYKESPSILSSEIYGYETEVQYWMPFVYGQGLHDADWKYEFGGNIYTYDGSHGCVNLPTYVAATIYEYVDQGFPVILFS